MPVERRGQAIAIWLGSTGVGSNRHQEEPDVQWKAAAFVRWHEPDDARVSSPDLPDKTTTVRHSSGCQCGIDFVPGANLTRVTNTPAFVGSPLIAPPSDIMRGSDAVKGSYREVCSIVRAIFSDERPNCRYAYCHNKHSASRKITGKTRQPSEDAYDARVFL
jgi:hypothetical protein